MITSGVSPSAGHSAHRVRLGPPDGATFDLGPNDRIAVTTLKALAPGVRVNLEVDLIARYVERMIGASREVR